MSDALPTRPNLEWLRKTAKQKLGELRSRDPAAQLADAQLSLARKHGFSSWRALKAHIDGLVDTSPALDDESVAAFLRDVGGGRIEALTESPKIVNAVGPHPY